MKSKIASAIEQYKKHQAELREKKLDERTQYLEFCSKESKRIVDALIDECLDDITVSGVSYVNVLGRHDNIFITRISGLVADALRPEGLELTLYRSIGIVKISIDPNYKELPE